MWRQQLGNLIINLKIWGEKQNKRDEMAWKRKPTNLYKAPVYTGDQRMPISISIEPDDNNDHVINILSSY